MSDKNNTIPPACWGILPQAVIDQNTGDALVMLAFKAALDRIRELEKRVMLLESRKDEYRGQSIR